MQGPAPSGAYYIPAPAMAPMPQTEATIKKKKVSSSVSTVHKIPKCHQVDSMGSERIGFFCEEHTQETLHYQDIV